MTAVDAGANESGQPVTTPEAAAAAATGPLAGNPSLMGLPTFIVGSVALGLVLVGLVPATAVGASLPIILAATATGLFIAAIWSAALGQSAVAAVYGIFAGFRRGLPGHRRRGAPAGQPDTDSLTAATESLTAARR